MKVAASELPADAPSAAAEWRAGWPLVLGAMLGYSAIALQAFLIGPYVLPMSKEFGWSRAEILSGISALHLTGIVFNYVGGAVIDRFGARRVALVGQVINCSALAALSLATPSLTGWAMHWVFVSLGASLMQATAWTRVVAAHFFAGRGLAIATVLTGSSLAGACSPLISAWLLNHFDWRTALAGSPLIWLAVTFPFSFALFRSPHARSRAAKAAAVARDGEAVDAATVAHASGWSLREAARNPVYWAVLSGMLCFAAYSLAVTPNLVPLLVEKGIDPTRAAVIASLLGFSGLVARLLIGHMFDRFPTHIVAGCAYLMPSLGLGLLLLPGANVPMLTVAVVLVGATLGAEYDVIIYMLTKHFGLRHFGKIMGSVLSVGAVGSATAPVLTGWVRDVTGNYDLALIVLAAVMIACAVAMFATGRSRTTLGAYAP